MPAELAHLAELLREVLPHLGGPYMHVEAHYEDAGWVGNRWAEILPLAPAQKQQLLELTDPLLRLDEGRGLVSPAAPGCACIGRGTCGARTSTR